MNYYKRHLQWILTNDLSLPDKTGMNSLKRTQLRPLYHGAVRGNARIRVISKDALYFSTPCAMSRVYWKKMQLFNQPRSTFIRSCSTSSSTTTTKIGNVYSFLYRIIISFLFLTDSMNKWLFTMLVFAGGIYALYPKDRTLESIAQIGSEVAKRTYLKHVETPYSSKYDNSWAATEYFTGNQGNHSLVSTCRLESYVGARSTCHCLS